MRKVVRDYSNKPDSLKGSNFVSTWNKLARREDPKVKRSIYSDPYYDLDGNTASRVIDKLNIWYHYKCAYCERIYKLDVEHYRPKGEVRDLNNDLVMVPDLNGNKIQHPGYYWLGYEWSNLIPACISCNRDGGKNSKFPNIINYISVPPLNQNLLEQHKCHFEYVDLMAEKPLMIHPEEDQVESMFKFRVDSKKKGIEILGADNEGRGDATIAICQMNRPEIRIDRLKNVVDPINKTLLAIVYSGKRKSNRKLKSEIESLLQKLYNDLNDDELTHTYLRKYILSSERNFQEIVLPFITDSLKEILFTAFKSYSPNSRSWFSNYCRQLVSKINQLRLSLLNVNRYVDYVIQRIK